MDYRYWVAVVPRRRLLVELFRSRVRGNITWGIEPDQTSEKEAIIEWKLVLQVGPIATWRIIYSTRNRLLDGHRPRTHPNIVDPTGPSDQGLAVAIPRSPDFSGRL